MLATYVKLVLSFNVETDADILEYLRELPNKTEAVRQMIRREIVKKRRVEEG